LSSGAQVLCGYIPSGTVNDFASSLMISKSPIEAAETIVNGKYKSIDAGLFNDDVFSYVAAFGLFTRVSYSTDQNMKNALGFFAYLIEIIKSMDLKHFNDASVHVRVVAGGRDFEDDCIFGYAGNTFSVGGLTNIVPQSASMDDGLLDLIFIKTPRSLQEIDRIRQAFMTNNLDIPEILCISSDHAEVFTERPIEWTLDGEYGGSTDHALLSIINKAIKIAVP
jgi:diacylglycerol kinase family enzyme